MGSIEGDRVPTRTWDGPSGLALLNATGRYASPNPSKFCATWRSVTADGVSIGTWSCTPMAGTRARSSAVEITLIAVLDGSLRYSLDDRTQVGTCGSIHLLSSRSSIRFAIPESSRLLVVRVPEAILPTALRATATRSIGAVRATRVTEGLIAVADQVLDPNAGGADSPAARALQTLAIAAVDDLTPSVSEEHGLRGRLVDYVDRHLSDPNLNPQTIAAEFGISLRWLHAVFNVDGASVARYIRDRRLDAVATQLQADRRFPRISTLAERNGFASRDLLTRAFKSRYGMTIAEYTEIAAQERGPEPTSAQQSDTA